MKDVMIDLETLGNHNNAVVTQMAGCYFNRETGEIGETLSLTVDISSSLRKGFEVTGSTIEWWLNQDKEAQLSMIAEPKSEVSLACQSFNDFLSKAKAIWSHATFDFVILMNHLHELNIKPRFSYRAARDIRTIVDLADVDVRSGEYKREGIHHNALDDCIYQVRYVTDCFRRLSK